MEAQQLLGLNVRKYRTAKHISQEELASRIGVDQAYLSRLEAGQINATVSTIGLLATALDIQASELLALAK